jgi:LysM repeat protein
MRLRTLLSLLAAAVLAAPSAASAAFQHVVTAGESLSSVASADGLSVDQLAAANGLSVDAQLIAGHTLLIPPQSGAGSGTTSSSTSGSSGSAAGSADDGGSEAAATGGDAAASGSGSGSGGGSGGSASGGSYVVQPGDTLSAIAARAGVSVSELAAINGLDVNGVLREGASLQLSGSSGGSAASSSGGAATSQPVGAAAQGSASSPPFPTPETVSASQVASIADANGVPASLAQAIGWQESGFNNDLVSSADARGVMQILPGTWDYIQRNLAGSAPLAPASAAENVRGGVLLLHSLLSATGGDPSLAAAGYYQGLPSVQQNGLYTDTQQYVNSVMALRQRFGGP